MRVDDDLSRLRVASVVEHDAESECERARAVVLKRFGEIPSASADLSRAVAYLQRRGYDEDTIRTVLRLPDE
jgi:SOS response regulatory protein OraA/RecX